LETPDVQVCPCNTRRRTDVVGTSKKHAAGAPAEGVLAVTTPTLTSSSARATTSPFAPVVPAPPDVDLEVFDSTLGTDDMMLGVKFVRVVGNHQTHRSFDALLLLPGKLRFLCLYRSFCLHS